MFMKIRLVLDNGEELMNVYERFEENETDKGDVRI